MSEPVPVPESTNALVTALVARLAVLPNIDVRPMPDHPRAQEFMHPKAALWVGYNGSRFDAPEAVDYPMQRRIVEFDCALLVRGLSGPGGANDYLDAIRERVHGYALPGTSRLRYMSEKFVDHQNGVWRYDLVLECHLMAIPALDAAPDSPAITRLELDSAYGHSELEPPDEGEGD